MCVCISAVTPLESRLSPFPPLPSSTTRRTSLFLDSRHNLMTFYTPPPLHASLSSPATPSLPSLRNSSRHLAPHATILAHDSARISLSLSLSSLAPNFCHILPVSPLYTTLRHLHSLPHLLSPTLALSPLYTPRERCTLGSRGRLHFPCGVYMCIYVYIKMYIHTCIY